MATVSSEPASNVDFVDGIIALSAIKEDAKNDLADILTNTRGRKCIIIESNLTGLFNEIVTERAKFLKENGVLYFKELKNDLEQLVVEMSRDIPENFIYIIRSHAYAMKLIASQITGLVKVSKRCQFKLCFVPVQSTVCVHLLEEYVKETDVLDRITYKELRVGFVPFDADLLSMEDEDIFRELFCCGDFSSLHNVAQALQKLQGLFGAFPNIKSKGALSRKVLQQLLHLRREEEEYLGREGVGGGRGRGEVDTLLLLDRDVDLFSLFVTPLTYEGLVDDSLGIENARIRLEAQLLGSDEAEASLTYNAQTNKLELAPPSKSSGEIKGERKPSPEEKVSVVLNSSDSIYGEIRGLSIERMGGYMQEKAIHIRERYAAFKENKDASLAEIHAFVKKIPKLTKDFRSLNQHIHIAELLKMVTLSRDFRSLWQGERGILEGESFLDELEDLIYNDCIAKKSFHRILKLLCLQSLTSGGVKGGKYDALRRLLVQVYGIEVLAVFQHLERAGLIKRRETMMVVESSPWQALKRQLRLLDEKVNMTKPEDISYVAAGYAPLSARLVQMLALSSASSRSVALEAMRTHIGGEYLDFTQQAHRPEELSDILSRLGGEGGEKGQVLSSSGVAGLSIFQQVMGSTQTGPAADDSLAPSSSDGSLLTSSFSPDQKKVMLVVLLGGVTYLEISALRYLSADPTFPFRIIVASTKIINHSTLLQSLQNI